jgi:hypothetical protein
LAKENIKGSIQYPIERILSRRWIDGEEKPGKKSLLEVTYTPQTAVPAVAET